MFSLKYAFEILYTGTTPQLHSNKTNAKGKKFPDFLE